MTIRDTPKLHHTRLYVPHHALTHPKESERDRGRAREVERDRDLTQPRHTEESRGGDLRDSDTKSRLVYMTGEIDES